MMLTTEFLIGALVGAVVVGVLAWWLWGRKVGVLASLQEQLRDLKALKVRLEGEANSMKTGAQQLEEANKTLIADKTRIENEKAAAEAVTLRCQSERSHLEGTVSRLQVEKSSINADFDRIKFDNQKLRERLAQVEDALQILETNLKEDLTSVEGVNEVLAYRLNRAGIRTLPDLASTAPQRLAELAGDAGINALKIVQTARAAVGLPLDDLERLNGVGPVIKRMLYNASIFTFAELSALTVEQLRAILGDRIQHASEAEALLTQAKELTSTH